MKRLLASLCLIVSLLIISTAYGAEVNVQINGETVNFNDTTAQIINSRTMVPFRKIFNELGVTDENIEWNGETKTIKAKKDNIEIALQIGNNMAEKKVGSSSNKITLDSAPVISNDRTLVPLRFIAESLGKTVGWDANNKTAVIIDYDYFLNCINSKSTALYNFLSTNSSDVKVSITRKYMDLENSNNNDTATISARIIESQEPSRLKQNVEINFSGTNELMKDIESEGWANIQYENYYYDNYFTTKALTDGWKKVYGQEQLKFLYTGLKCKGQPTDSISDVFKNMCAINEKNINAQTFKLRRDEFSKFLKLFKVNSPSSLTTGNISSESFKINYFDFTQLDDTMFDTSVNRVWSFINSQVFHFDVTLDELCYDYPTVNATININNLELTIDFILSNQYNEKVEYIVKINK